MTSLLQSEMLSVVTSGHMGDPLRSSASASRMSSNNSRLNFLMCGSRATWRKRNIKLSIAVRDRFFPKEQPKTSPGYCLHL